MHARHSPSGRPAPEPAEGRWRQTVRFICTPLVFHAVAAALACPSASAAPVQPSFQWLTHSSASAVNADGSVVVGTHGSALGYEAFRWTPSGGVQGLGDLPGGNFESWANGVNGDGSVVVGNGRPAAGYEAFRWTASGGMQGLGNLPGGTSSFARGVSGDGSVIVGDSGGEAFRWTAGGGMQGLGDLPGATVFSVAGGVSADGLVVVGRSESASGPQAFRWTASGGMQGLGDLPNGFFRSEASAASADGSVIVGHGSSEFGTQAFRWTAAGGIQGLGDLSGRFLNSQATGVSADGSVVVGNSGGGPFIWDATHGMRSLYGVLVNDYGLDLTGPYGSPGLSSVSAISADGRVIVGWSDNGLDADGDAWIAVIPEPSSLALLGAGGILLITRRRRRQGPERDSQGRVPAPYTSVAIFTAAALVTLAPSRTSAAGGSFQRLDFSPTGVSADGSVVVGSRATGSEQERAVRWTRAGGTQPLELGDAHSVASDVSADGSVVVGQIFLDSGPEAFRWTAGGGMERLGDLPGGTFASGATGVSADGSVVVGHGHSGGALDPFQAFRWTAAGGMQGLGPVSSDIRSVSVSGDGSVVAGTRAPSSGSYEAFRWTQSGGVEGLGDLPGGASVSLAFAISADGSTIVGASPSSFASWEPFRWTQSGGMHGLGPPYTGFSGAYGVSANGSVIVGWDELGGAPFIWDAANGTRSLQQVLTNDYGLDLGGAELITARAISADGRTIVGDGWIATIPEPSSLAVLGLTCLLLLPRRRDAAKADSDPRTRVRREQKPG